MAVFGAKNVDRGFLKEGMVWYEGCFDMKDALIWRMVWYEG